MDSTICEVAIANDLDVSNKAITKYICFKLKSAFAVNNKFA